MEASTLGLISAISARCLLQKGCKGYLAHVVDTRSSEVRFEDVPVVRDFLDVFPDDLPSLPPEREIDFPINLSLVQLLFLYHLIEWHRLS